jgi:hypothetical protein
MWRGRPARAVLDKQFYFTDLIKKNGRPGKKAAGLNLN